jgi:Zn-dependent protease with chaperone function
VQMDSLDLSQENSTALKGPPRGPRLASGHGKQDSLPESAGGREAVYVVKIIEVPQAAVALHGRAVVLVSQPALDLLDPDELRALVLHDVGHEYFWSEYFRARRDNDRLLLQTLELLCDGLAIVTLRHAGMDPKRLTSALEKIFRYNRDRFGAALNEDAYPAIGERRRFARRLVEWLGRSGVP